MKGTKKKYQDNEFKKSKVLAGRKDGIEAISNIFSEINARKRKVKSLSVAMRKEQMAKKSMASTPPAGSRPKSIGLYRNPDKTVELSDQEFFNAYNKQPSIACSKYHGELKTREGVDSILSVRQLQKMLSRDPKAGTTIHCPFDCDCCF